MNLSEKEKKELQEEYKKFFINIRSLVLSTIDKTGQPQSSYSPFVTDEQKNFYIFVSFLAYHTNNLLNFRKAGVMLIESEEKTDNIFSRKRIIFECEVEKVSRNEEKWEKIMKKFDDSFGQIMSTLRMLSDFQLIRLRPISGRFIKGFGSAFEISGREMDQLIHLNPQKK